LHREQLEKDRASGKAAPKKRFEWTTHYDVERLIGKDKPEPKDFDWNASPNADDLL
jgi:hypothetical protein